MVGFTDVDVALTAVGLVLVTNYRDFLLVVNNGTGKPIVEVGFGVTSERTVIYGTKKWINGTIDSFAPDQVDIDVTSGSQDGEYYGDSGGPLFFQMPDSTWRVIGVDYGSPAFIEGSTAPRVSAGRCPCRCRRGRSARPGGTRRAGASR